jgi:hypothetical protein
VRSTLLNRGESVHQLQRAVYSGKVTPERGKRRDEMKAISGSHALLTNVEPYISDRDLSARNLQDLEAVRAGPLERLQAIADATRRSWPAIKRSVRRVERRPPRRAPRSGALRRKHRWQQRRRRKLARTG